MTLMDVGWGFHQSCFVFQQRYFYFNVASTELLTSVPIPLPPANELFAFFFFFSYINHHKTCLAFSGYSERPVSLTILLQQTIMSCACVLLVMSFNHFQYLILENNLPPACALHWVYRTFQTAVTWVRELFCVWYLWSPFNCMQCG